MRPKGSLILSPIFIRRSIRAMNSPSTAIVPTKPHSSPKVQKMKSVCFSGTKL